MTSPLVGEPDTTRAPNVSTATSSWDIASRLDHDTLMKLAGYSTIGSPSLASEIDTDNI